jgi:hypothetical protein
VQSNLLIEEALKGRRIETSKDEKGDKDELYTI